jgi:hypothetical protein
MAILPLPMAASVGANQSRRALVAQDPVPSATSLSPLERAHPRFGAPVVAAWSMSWFNFWPRRRRLERLALIGLAAIGLPLFTVLLVDWPSRLNAFVPVFGYSLFLCAPLAVLRSSWSRGWGWSASATSILASSLAATYLASAVLLLAAVASQVFLPVASGGEVISKSCHDQTCRVGTFDHRLNTHLEFTTPLSAAPEIGSWHYQCLSPSWPQPSRLRWQTHMHCPEPDRSERARPAPKPALGSRTPRDLPDSVNP